MKALSALLGVSVLQAANGAHSAVVSFNKAMARANDHSHVSFDATSSDPLPYDLMLKAADYGDEQVPCSGGDEDNDPPGQYDGEATIALAISQCLSDNALTTIENWVTTLESGGLSLYDGGKQRKIKFVTRVVPSACTKSLPVGYASTSKNTLKKKSGKTGKHHSPNDRNSGVKHNNGNIDKPRKMNTSDHKDGKYGSAMKIENKAKDKDGINGKQSNSTAISSGHINEKHGKIGDDDKKLANVGRDEANGTQNKPGKTVSDAVVKGTNGRDDHDDNKGKQGKNGKDDDDDSKGRQTKIDRSAEDDTKGKQINTDNNDSNSKQTKNDKAENDSKIKQITIDKSGNYETKSKQTNSDNTDSNSKQTKSDKTEKDDNKSKQNKSENIDNGDSNGKLAKNNSDDDDDAKSKQAKNDKASNDDSKGKQKKSDKTDSDNNKNRLTKSDKADDVDTKSKQTKTEKAENDDYKRKQTKVDKSNNDDAKSEQDKNSKADNANDKRSSSATEIYGITTSESYTNDGKTPSDSSIQKSPSDSNSSYSKTATDKIAGDNKSTSASTSTATSTNAGNNPKGNTNGKSDESKTIDKGKKSTHNLRMLRGVDSQDRFSPYSKFGSVITGLPDYATGAPPSNGPIGIISFVDNHEAYDAVAKYASAAHIENAYYFQLCDQNVDGCTSANSYANAVPLYNNMDLFMYNPFMMSHELQCADLEDGVPVAYVDAYGKRQCFCTCPAGYEMADVVSNDGTSNYKMCSQVDSEVCPCTWSTHGGYTHEVTTALDVCLFQKIASNWSVPAPFPNDNYVANGRPNDRDSANDLSSGPQISVGSTRESAPVYNYASVSKYMQEASTDYATTHVMPDNLPDYLNSVDYRRVVSSVAQYETTDSQSNQYTWIDYEQNRQQAIDSLKFTSYGKYDLKLVANDYSSSAECNGCLAIVDKFRPKATTVCPSNFSASTYGGEVIPVAAKDILEKASNAIKLFYDFQANATNDGCSQGNRCDVESFRVKDFFQSNYKSMDSYSDGRKCFDALTVYESFLTSTTASTNPLLVANGYSSSVSLSQDEKPVPDGQCTRCCDLSTSLRERWVDYTCGSNYDLERCEGDTSQSCSLSQCLSLKPDTLAIASTCVKAAVKEESQKVVDELSGDGFQTTTQIHRALECSKFGGQDDVCRFETTIDDLFDRQVKTNFELGKSADINKFVFWRYRVRDAKSEWQSFESNKTTTFTKPDTEIIVEAWTQCGILYSGCYHVLLHVQSPVQVCDHFSKMWYQTSTKHNGGSQDSTTLCQYPQSDFAELTFDFHAKAGIPREDGKSVRTKVTSVVCQLAYASRSNVTIVNVQKTAPEIISRFAVKLVDQPTTALETHLAVSCDFVYARYGSPPFTQTCAKSFAIKDCTTTEVDPETEQCLYDDCAGDEKPGPYEACGGQMISATRQETLFSTKELQCCQACRGLATTQCEFVLNVPNESNNIKRCVPQFQPTSYGHNDGYGGGGGDFSPFSALISTGSNLISVGENHGNATAAIGGIAVIAVVALIVVRRRRGAAAQTPQSIFMEEAQSPLLR